MERRTIIMGAAGKDFHVFNTVFRNDADTKVVAFTATQIPGIDGRTYPAALAGPLYPEGIPIEPEERLLELIKEHEANDVVFAYSDVSYELVDSWRARVEATGAHFDTAPTEQVMIPSRKPVIAVCAVRTGCGKSQTTRFIGESLARSGRKVAAIRHPMPYGDLAAQAVQRFATLDDLVKHKCTIEEMEEYEPHIANGLIVYAGVDYGAILERAEEEAEIILWDGGNNDTPFYRPDLYVTVVDPHRPGHELSYYPGRENLRRADVIVFNKMDSAEQSGVERVEANVNEQNPEAVRIYASSPIKVADPSVLAGKRVLAVEDGPTLTHGGMQYGAGVLAARQAGAAELVDPRPYVVGELKQTFEHYPGIGPLLPAMGYGEQQVRDLQATIDAVDCDAVVIGTPIDLSRIVEIKKPHTRATYDLEQTAGPDLMELVEKALAAKSPA